MNRSAPITTAFVIITMVASVWFINLQFLTREVPESHAEEIKEYVAVTEVIIESQQNRVSIGQKSMRVGSTALDLLKATTKVSMTGEGVNAYVTAINGREASTPQREFWALYVNGKQADVGAGSYVLQEADSIEWKLETY